MRILLLVLLAGSAGLMAANSPIASGYGADGPYAGGAVVTYTITNPIDVGVTLKPVRVYVSSSAPAGPLPVFAISHAYGADRYLTALDDYLPEIYPDLVRWAIGKGWSVIFVPYPNQGSPINIEDRYDILWSGFQAAAADPTAGPRIDTSRLCVWGHSFGGGAVPWLAWQASHESGWGGNGLCAMACAPWYMYRMPSERLGQFPAGMDLLLQVYDQDTVNDHQMAIQTYTTAAMPAANKDYVLVSGGSYNQADHAAPSSGGPNPEAVLDDLDWHGVIRPVDAMIDHAWHGVDAGRVVALGHGAAEQQAMPGQTSLTSLWDGPIAHNPPGALSFPWSEHDSWQPLPSVALGPVPATVDLAQPVALSAEATTPNLGGSSIHAVTFRSGSVVIATVRTAPYTATWTPQAVGVVEVTVTAEDSNGRTATATTLTTVVGAPGNHPPIVAHPPVAHSGTVGVVFAYVLPGDTFSDPDGDTLAYSASGLPAGLAFDPPSRTCSGTPSAAGSATVVITADDGNGGQVSTSLVISIAAGSSGQTATVGGGSSGCGAGTALAAGLAFAFAMLGLRRRR